MSRTYHHNWSYKRVEWNPDDTKARLHFENGWMFNEPKWWRKLMKHRARRAEWKQLKERTVDWENAV